MTREEFKLVGDYAIQLWPKFILTDAQKEMWFHKLRYFSEFDARKALGEAYAAGKWKEPTLAEVLHVLRSTIRMDSRGGLDFTPALTAQVEREEVEDRALLAQWSREELQAGKDEIIRNEPGMELLAAMIPTGSFWTHFLVERYVHQRVIIFPNGRPIQIHRDDYWSSVSRQMKAVPV